MDIIRRCYLCQLESALELYKCDYCEHFLCFDHLENGNTGDHKICVNGGKNVSTSPPIIPTQENINPEEL